MRQHHTAASLLAKYNPQTLGDVRPIGRRRPAPPHSSNTCLPGRSCSTGPRESARPARPKQWLATWGCVEDFGIGGISENPQRQTGRPGRRRSPAFAPVASVLRLQAGRSPLRTRPTSRDARRPERDLARRAGAPAGPGGNCLHHGEPDSVASASGWSGRCEVVEFDGSSPAFVRGMHDFIRHVW